jgi:multiple sugar transport system substrate-binding protein
VGGASSGGQAPAASEAPVHLDVWFFHDQWKDAFDQVIGNYRSTHPNTSITFGAPQEGYSTKIVTALVSGAGPDVMSVNWNWVRMWSEKGNLFDLTSEASRDKSFAKDLAAYHPKIQAYMKWQGRQWGVGLDHDDVAVFWNVNLFKQAQLQPLTDLHDKWTWNDVIELARRLTKAENQQYGFYAHGAAGQTGWWNFVYANGGKVLNDDGTKADPMLQPEATDAIQWLADARLKHGVSPGPEQMQAAVGSTSYINMFAGGKLAMMTDGSWRVNAYVTQIKEFEWDVAHIPLAPRTGKRSSTLHGTGFGVNKDGHAIEESMRFVKHLATRETHHVYGSTGIIQSARMDEWDGFYANPKPPAHRNVLKAAVDYAEPYLLTGQWGIQTWDAEVPLDKACTQIYAGALPARDGLRGAVEAYNTQLADLVAKSKR